jgi:hypothetical protein
LVLLGALALTTGVVAITATTPAQANGGQEYFERIATYDVANNGNETAEIVAASQNGKLLVFTDSDDESVGFVDIKDPASPQGLGTLQLRTASGSACIVNPAPGEGVEGESCEPTSVAVARGDKALVAVNTSTLVSVEDDGEWEFATDYTRPDGFLAIVDLRTQSIQATLELGGQPDSVAVNGPGNRGIVAIENERNEDIQDGELPQLPAGFAVVVDMFGPVSSWTTTEVNLTGLPGVDVPEDPEPEYASISGGTAAVTLQENNAVVLIDLVAKIVVDSWTVGTVSLTDVDTVEDDQIILNGAFVDRPREPDALAWIPGDRIATADEGDLFGGTRGFTVFEADGSIAFEADTTVEHAAVAAGHYPEGRSENKGNEPEGIAYAQYGNDRLLFIGSERGNFIAVYPVERDGEIGELAQIMPTTIGPEGLLPIPQRGLFVVASETVEGDWASTLTIFHRTRGLQPGYPEIISASDPLPIGWVALSGLASDGDTVYAVHDSFLDESSIYRIDTSSSPAVITDDLVLTDGSGGTFNYDLEGIEVVEDGFWLASEGAVPGSLQATENLLVYADGSGVVTQEVTLPADIVACRDETIAYAAGLPDDDPGKDAAVALARSLRFGFEGVTEHDGHLYVAQQREWAFTPGLMAAGGSVDCDGLSAPTGTPTTRIWRYEIGSGNPGTWDHVEYELDGPGAGTWVGLSEITHVGNGDFVLIERDNRVGNGDLANTIKNLVLIEDLPWFFSSGITVTDDNKSKYSLIPALTNTNGWMPDKPEGFTVFGERAIVVTDNDGVDDAAGETRFIDLGGLRDLFGD